MVVWPIDEVENKMAAAHKHRHSGFTLVEILVAILILAVLALGGASILYHAGSTVAIQKNKRVAIEAASRKLEQLRAVPYANIRPPSGGVHYLDRFNNVVPSQPDETVSINGIQRPIIATVQRISASSPDREYVQVVVKVEYRAGVDWASVATNLR